MWDVASTYGDIVAEFDADGSSLASYVLGHDHLISQTQGSTTSYFAQDAIGSTRALTNAAGSVTESYTYSAFGTLLDGDSTATPYLYTGHRFDASSGLYQMRARYYDPNIGRFLTQDTWRIDRGNPVELNTYGYVAGNPVGYTDPTGHNLAESGINWNFSIGIGAESVAKIAFIALSAFAITAIVFLLLNRQVDAPPDEQEVEVPPSHEAADMTDLTIEDIIREFNGNGNGNQPGNGSPFGRILRWLLQEEVARRVLEELQRRTRPACDPQAFAQWWTSLPDGPQGPLTTSAGLWENSVARNGLDTFPGIRPKRISIPGAAVAGYDRDTLDADGATRNTCRLVEAKHHTGTLYDGTRGNEWLYAPGQELWSELHRYRLSIQISPANALEIRTNRALTEPFYIAALQATGFTYGRDGFVSVYYGP